MENRRSGDNKVITIYDIASEAGVSVSTVSRVLTNNANVRPEKKEKVQQLINKYNFKPNAMARGLSDTKSRVIGIVAADVRNPYYAEVFVACENAAREAGYTVLLCNSQGITQWESQQLAMLQEQRVDAVIQLGGRADDLNSDPEYVEKVNQMIANIPLVVTGKLDGTRCYQVQIDAAIAAELLLEHLLSLGHRKIALVGGRQSVASTYVKKRKYAELLEKYEIEYRPEFIVDGDYDYETGYVGMNRLAGLLDVPTAVVAINDSAAAGVMRSAVDHGYRIPQDISVVSYDNTSLTELLIPKLTSVDYDYETLGRRLVETAIAAVKKSNIPLCQRITPTLVVRESSARVPGTGER